MEQKPYFKQVDIQNTVKLRELLASLPPFCGAFFRGIEPTTASRTRIAYAYDLKVFFEFLVKENPLYRGKEIRDITLSDLDMIKPLDLEEYMEYLKYRFNEKNQEIINKERGIIRKISSLKSFYNYFFRLEKQIAQVVEEKKEKQKLYRCVGILSGLFLVILLL